MDIANMNVRLSHLRKEIESVYSFENTMATPGENQIFTANVIAELDRAKSSVDDALTVAQQKDIELLKDSIGKVQSSCGDIVSIMRELKLPLVKPKWCDLTDAGPGVGISNFEVKFRDVEL